MWQHDGVSVVVHFVMCKRYGFPAASKWYEHIPETALENDNVKIHIFICKYIDRRIDR